MAKEFGDPWEDRYHFKTKPTVRAHLRIQSALVRRDGSVPGLLYVAVLIARLVSLYSRTKSRIRDDVARLLDRADIALKSYDKTWCIHNTSRLASRTAYEA